MTPFRDLSLSRKLLVMTLTSSAAALVLASGGFLAWDITRARSEIHEDIDAQARLVADNSAAPLTFADEQTAGETLAVLRLRPRVVMSCLYDSSGGLFATYHRDRGTSCPLVPPPGTTFTWRVLEVTVPVQSGIDRVGTLFIRRELGDVAERLRVGLGTVAGLLAIAFVAAFLVAARIQRSISAPLLQLADTARTITTARDYSLRATAVSADEIGTVVKAFNDMLDQINAALERERDANRLKDEFLATLSHELRTPLNAVLGWTRILRAAPSIEPATQRRALDSIERNAHAQARLIEDLLEVSRIVTGKLRLHVVPVDLAAVVDAAVEIVRPAAAAKQIRLETEVRPRPAMTLGDPDRLQQIIWNLLSNAVKFTPAGGRISITLARPAGYHLAISDSGIGIDPAFLPHAFEPFRQADGTARREHGGLGLGLAIAKQLVELHGGTIRVTSEGSGRGATFEIVLPSVMSDPATRIAVAGAQAPNAETTVDPSLLRNRHVLIVDDDEDARAVLEIALSQYGAEVIAVASAAEAIEELDRGVPDVLLSDIGMAHEDGLMLLRRVRARPAAAGGQVPAVAVTAYASARDRDAATSAGYQAHVAKPFDPHDLARLVARLAGAEATGPM
jgi:signal transduction histidine kinase/ActR/RegA family two-component response regulator